MSNPVDPHLRHRKYGDIRPMHWRPRKPSVIATLVQTFRAYRDEHAATFSEDVAIVMMLIGVVMFTVLALGLV